LTLVNKKRYRELIKSEDVEISIAPTLITIGVVLKNINGPNLANAYSFKGGEAEALEIIVDKSKNRGIIDKSVEEIDLPVGCNLGAILSSNEVKIAHHDVKIKENDHLIIFLSDKNKYEELEKSLM
jgi:trk system potassium uptake protein TrkA